MRKLPNLKFLILLLVVWQLFSVLLMAIGVWPYWVVWVNLAMAAVFVSLAPVYDSLLLLSASIPFYVVIPNRYFDTLSTWRVLFALLFFVWLARIFLQKSGLPFWRRVKTIKFLPWDKYLGLFAVTAFAVTAIFAKFPLPGFKQIAFWLNIYLLYIVLVNTIKTKDEVKGLVKYTVWSFAVIVATGFVQLLSTFFTNLDVFWVYWASFVTKLFYGTQFAEVALYSNSWFSYVAGRDLRMFSIMPDSQSFGYVAVMGAFWALALTAAVSSPRVRYFLWSGVRSASLAVILSGTRAVWVGLFGPLLITLFLYYKNTFRFFIKKTAWIMVIVLLLFAASPLINMGLQHLRLSVFRENFADRVKSIYDLNEQSNFGRLIIWQDSLVFAAGRPLGVGLGNFIVSLSGGEDYALAAEEIHPRYNLPNKYVTGHSLYLQILVELGIAGLLVFSLFWFKFYKTVWGFLRGRRDDKNFYTFFVFQVAMMFIWLLCSAVFDVTLFNDKVLMYFFLSLGLAGVIINKYEEWPKGD